VNVDIHGSLTHKYTHTHTQMHTHTQHSIHKHALTHTLSAQVEGLIHFVTGIKAALELGLQDKEQGTGAEVRKDMRRAFDQALGVLQKSMHKVFACVRACVRVCVCMCVSVRVCAPLCEGEERCVKYVQ
jgi:hypothetical protein